MASDEQVAIIRQNLHALIKKLRGKNTELLRQNKELEQQLAQAREENERLTGQRDALQIKNQQLDARCVDLFHEQERLREEAERWQRSYEQTKDNADQLERQLAQKREDAKKYATAVIDMRDVIGKEEQAIFRLQEQNAALRALLEQWSAADPITLNLELKDPAWICGICGAREAFPIEHLRQPPKERPLPFQHAPDCRYVKTRALLGAKEAG